MKSKTLFIEAIAKLKKYLESDNQESMLTIGLAQLELVKGTNKGNYYFRKVLQLTVLFSITICFVILT
jgi:hypothetical protein